MDRKIRVLHLIDNLDLGGAQTVLFGLLEYFDRNRFEILLASMHANRKSLFFGRAARLGVRVVPLSPRRWLPFYLVTLPWLLFRGRFDVVHTHLYASNWIGKPLAKLFSVPAVISHDHCYDRFRFDRSLISMLDAWANRFADRILVIANSIREELIETERVGSEKIEIMRNGLPARSFASRPPADRKIVGAAGRLVAWKRFDRFLRVSKHLLELDSEYQFRLAGSGPREQSLRLMAKELGISERVVWCGAVSNMDDFFASIDLFLLSSEFEDLPMVLLEAMYHRVPSAAVSVNASRAELAGDILALDPRDTEAGWARAIHGVFQNPEGCLRLGERGRSLIEQEYMAENCVKRLEKLYSELVLRH
ncbi:MAG TPA: glycosyltransferase family 4 protein [Chthoniobacterales bacterium]|jgi:glycosyltransferase involved in cell wall biosynthesis|nr:glycosyltransferase family 4 protein [Chthoniobacterales bacterium]